MAYVSLYRKYRPQTFHDIVGQDHVTGTLVNAIQTGQVHHAMLFCGTRGTGKTSTARVLAKALNCVKGPTPEPCNVCDACVSITDGTNLDVTEIDAASHGSVDDARDLREKASYAPAAARYKVYIIDEAHMVTTQGFNAMLKVLEEPPEHVRFVFCTTEPHKVIEASRSRSASTWPRRWPPTGWPTCWPASSGWSTPATTCTSSPARPSSTCATCMCCGSRRSPRPWST